MKTSILIVDKKEGNFQESTASKIVILCNQQKAKVIKDRMGKTFGLVMAESDLIKRRTD